MAIDVGAGLDTFIETGSGLLGVGDALFGGDDPSDQDTRTSLTSSGIVSNLGESTTNTSGQVSNTGTALTGSTALSDSTTQNIGDQTSTGTNTGTALTSGTNTGTQTNIGLLLVLL